VARLQELKFEEFVAGRRAASFGAGESGRDPGHAYAYAWDKKTRATFERVKAVELAVAATVRMFKNVGKAQLLGNAVRIGPRQFPRMHALTEKCASTLGINTPAVYVVNNPHLNAMTFGTNDDSFIIVHSALVDHHTDEELLSVIGHECGHIHNNHVVYLTAMYYLRHLAGFLLQQVALPATLALQAWSRRAEITCDRAGALCAGDMDAAVRALAKLALGSQKLYEQLDIDAFVEQNEESQASFGRFSEVLATHPWLSKRVLALKTFGESELYRRHVGIGNDGLSMSVVDEKVHDIIKVMR
jgi:Zn-dependent protease with chaperone function